MSPGEEHAATSPRPRLELGDDPEGVRRGLGRLALVLVRLVHELLERQAVRRMEAGTLSDEEVERVGHALYLQAREIENLRTLLGLEDDDLNLDLGPLGRLI